MTQACETKPGFRQSVLPDVFVRTQQSLLSHGQKVMMVKISATGTPLEKVYIVRRSFPLSKLIFKKSQNANYRGFSLFNHFCQARYNKGAWEW